MTEEEKKKDREKKEGLDNLVDKQIEKKKQRITPSINEAEMKVIMDNIRKKAAEKKLQQLQAQRSEQAQEKKELPRQPVQQQPKIEMKIPPALHIEKKPEVKEQPKHDIRSYAIKPNYDIKRPVEKPKPIEGDEFNPRISPFARAEVERIVKVFEKIEEKQKEPEPIKAELEQRDEETKEILEELPEFLEKIESEFVKEVKERSEKRESKTRREMPDFIDVFSKRNVSIMLIIFVLVIFSTFAFVKFPELGITGKATEEFTLDASQSAILDRYITSNKNLSLTLKSNKTQFKSLSLFGNFIGDGRFKIYLETDRERLLVVDSNNLKKDIDPLTGTVNLREAFFNSTIDSDSNNGMQIFLEYDDASEWDIENDGIAHVQDVVDFTVKNSIVPEDTSLICTRWTVNDQPDLSTCHGSGACCNFLGFSASSTDWSAPFHLHAGMDGAGKENSVKARIVNFDLSDDMNITYTGEAALPAKFYQELYSFTDSCEGTCNITGAFVGNYKLVIEISDDIYLTLDEMSYSVIPLTEAEEIITDFPEIVLEEQYGWNGDYRLEDNYDGTFDLEIFTKPRAKQETGEAMEIISTVSEVEIEGIKKIRINKITPRIDEPNEDNITTEIFALEEDFEFESATLTLRKLGPIDAVFYCSDFNVSSFICTDHWSKTDIPFEDNEGTITFTINKFSAYAGGILEGFEFNPEIRDANGNLMEYDLELEEVDTGIIKTEEIRKSTGFGEQGVKAVKVGRGIYNIKVKPKSSPIKSIAFKGVKIDSRTRKFLDLDDVPEDDEYLSGFEEVYAIDPSAFDFDNATVTVVAKGTTLHKCKNWNFTARECMIQEVNCTPDPDEEDSEICDYIGGWEYLMDTVPGEEYTFTLTPDDPGFAEGSPTSGTADDGNYVFIISQNAEEKSENTYVNTQLDDSSYYCTGYKNAYINGTNKWYTYFDFNISHLNIASLDNLTFEWRGYATGRDTYCGPYNDPPECSDGHGTCQPSNIRIYDWVADQWDILNSSLYTITSAWDYTQQTIVRSNMSPEQTWYDNSTGMIRVAFEHHETGMSRNYETLLVHDFVQLTLGQTSNYTAMAPNITLVGPGDNSYDANGILKLKFSVVDLDSGIENCTANLNGTLKVLDSVQENQMQVVIYNNTAEGTYNWNITCYDDSANSKVATSETRTIIVDRNGLSGQADFNVSIKDALGNDVTVQMEFIDAANEEVDDISNYSTTHNKNLGKGRYNIRVTPASHVIKEILIENITINGSVIDLLDIDDPQNGIWRELYAINPTLPGFTNASVTVTATGEELFKCASWNFTTRTCPGTWAKLMDITPGQDYTFNITATDPALAELGGTVFEDWETGTFATNNWTVTNGPTSGWIVSTSEGPIDTYHAIARNTDGETVLVTNVSTAGYENITFSFWWATDSNNFDGPDYYYADWYNGTAWVNVFSHLTGRQIIYTLASYNLPSSADNNLDFKIRFRCNVNLGSEGCDLDNIIVNGSAIPDFPPNVSLNYPPQGYFNDTSDPVNITFNCSATDDLGLVNISLYITNSTNESFSLNQTTNIGGTSNSTTWILELANGDYTWNCLAFDTDNYSDWGDNNRTVLINFTVPAPTAPTSNSPADQTVDIGDDTTIGWILQDDVAPGYYLVERNGSLFTGPASWLNNTPLFVQPNTYFLGTWNYTVFYNDSVGNNGTPDTVFVTVIDNSTPSCANFSDPNAPAFAGITIDGDVSDWDPILANPANYVSDLPSGAGDLDTVIPADRDQVIFAYTWDNDTLYFYFRRVNSGDNQVSMIAYMDYGLDGYMNATDQVIKFVWTGTNRQYDSDIYNYIPSGTADQMNGDGNDMPGSITINKSIETNVFAGTVPGIELEARVNWTDLGFSGPVPILFQPASAVGSGTNLPSQVEDNMGAISTLYSSLLFQPDHFKAAANGTSVYYDHDLANCGLMTETIDLANVSSQGFSVTYFYPNGTQITDSNGNNIPDVTLGVDNFTTLVVKIDIPGATATGTIDVTTITATPSNVNTSSKTVTDTTSVGQIAIIPNTRIISGTENMQITLNYTVYNFGPNTDTIEANVTSSQGWNVSILNANGTIINDTDGDNHTDLGPFMPGEAKDILLKIYIPAGASIGTNDISTIIINSSNISSLYASATANTTVKARLTIEPDYNRSVGIGDSTFYYLTVTHNWNESDVIDISHTYQLNYPVQFLEDDMITLLTDTDNDSIVDIGTIGPYGEQYNLYAKITVPSNASDGDSEFTTVFANASLNTSVHNISKINTTVSAVVTYSDSSRSTEEINFNLSDTVYARAHGLVAINNVYFQWIDSNNTVIKTSSDIAVTSADKADDLLNTNSSMLQGYWTLIVFDAQNDLELGRTIFFLGDNNPPAVVLNYPPNGFGTSNTTINFNWTATDDFDTNFLCNLTIDGVVNASNISVQNNTPENYSVSGFSTGQHNWSVTCWDSFNNTNTSETRTFTVDNTPPNITLNFPPNGYLTTHTTINFNWTAIDDLDTNLTCNLTLDSAVNVSNIDSLNNTPTNYTVFGLSPGTHTWSVTCWDDANNINTSQTRNFSILFVSAISYTLTLPGQAPVQCNNTPPYPATASMEFNSTNGTDVNVDPCVVGTGACQNSTVPFFIFTNTGTVNLTWIVNLNQSLPSVFNMKANTVYNSSSATNITTAQYNLSANIGFNLTSNGFFFGDFLSALNNDSTSRELIHNGT